MTVQNVNEIAHSMLSADAFGRDKTATALLDQHSCEVQRAVWSRLAEISADAPEGTWMQLAAKRLLASDAAQMYSPAVNRAWDIFRERQGRRTDYDARTQA